MSLLRDYQSSELGSFGGAWLLQDPSMVPQSAALRSQNVEFAAGMVGVRKGFGQVNTGAYPLALTNTSVREMYCWYAPFSDINTSYGDAALVALDVLDLTDVVLGIVTIKGLATYNLGAGVAIGGLSTLPVGASFTGVGMRLYYAYFDVAQHSAGTMGGCATAYGSAGSLAFAGTANSLFPGPSTYAPSTSEPGAGLVTAGVHRVGYLIEYKNGFTTRVSPDTGATYASLNTFAPITFTATGSKNARLTITNTWDAEVVAISAIMTTTTNLNQYYIVPGSRTAVSASFTITFDITDADLSSQGIDATPYLYWTTQAGSATGGPVVTLKPFLTRHLCLWGDRMAYLATQVDNNGTSVDVVYVSERNNYQAVTSDQHIIQLPGQRSTVTLFSMGGNHYIAGPHEIYAVSDNGDVPATWSAPRLIDGRFGTQAIHGVEVSPSGNYAWIADQSGLYLFTGAPITSLPASYQQSPDWDRINWASAYCIKIKDDASNTRVQVMVPLDGATSPSHIMTFDYTRGSTWDAIQYSLDSVAAGYGLGSMELVRNDLAGQATGNQGKVELWLGSTTILKPILRRMSDVDTNPYRDNAALAINASYRTCPLPERGGVINIHHGFHARLKGSGVIIPVLRDIDAARSFTCRSVTLAAAPDADILCLADLRGELGYVEFATNTLDYYWKLAYLKYYYSPYLIQR